MNAGMDATVRLITYWTLGTDKTNISTKEGQSNIRESIRRCEESQCMIPDTHPIKRSKYHQNIQALSESIGTDSWREPQPQESGSGFVKTDINIEQVAMYLKPEYQLLWESLKSSGDQHRNHCKQELIKTVFEPLKQATEGFENGDHKLLLGMKGDPEFASLVKSEWIVSFDQALDNANEANLPGRV